MKNIKSKLFGFVAAVVVALSLPATGHSQILYNGYFNIDWQYNWPLGDSYADKSSGWGMNFEGGYYFPSNVGLGAFIAFHTNNKYARLFPSAEPELSRPTSSIRCSSCRSALRAAIALRRGACWNPTWR